MQQRPNILFLMSDQHRADIAGFAGDEIVRTPTLDRLARDGVVFTNAYTPSPICIPARQCMMSGQLPKTCGCQGWFDLSPNYHTFSRQFTRYAYNTVCSGKLHHQGIDQMQGWRTRIEPDAVIGEQYLEDKIEEEYARYSPPPGTGKWSNQREIEEARAGDGPYQKFDRRVVRASLDFLEGYFVDPLYQRPQYHRPLLFKQSLVQPHYPFFTEKKKFERYLNSVTTYMQQPCDHPVLSLSQQEKPVCASPEAIRRATAAYYGMIETMDSYHGRVLDTLEALGQDLDDWIIVYTSDHGEMLGEHGIWEKTRFYEASVRVPLIIRWPKGFQGGRICDQNVNLCDLYATLCELAGLETPAGLDSRSLVPLLNGNSEGWSNETISQFENRHLMIKQDQLKYQYYGEDIDEVLFDLSTDPLETRNVAALPDYATVMSRFRTRRAQLGHGPDADPHYKNAGYA